MTMAADEKLSIELRLGDDHLADDIEAWLAEHGAIDVTRGTERGFLDVLPIFIAGLLALRELAALVVWIHDKTRCRVLIDARHERIYQEIDCRSRDGRVVVVTKDDEKVEIFDVPPMRDFTGIINAAVSLGADGVAKAAEAAGMSVERKTPN
jgi:hypothetical protein